MRIFAGVLQSSPLFRNRNPDAPQQLASSHFLLALFFHLLLYRNRPSAFKDTPARLRGAARAGGNRDAAATAAQLPAPRGRRGRGQDGQRARHQVQALLRRSLARREVRRLQEYQADQEAQEVAVRGFACIPLLPSRPCLVASTKPLASA